MLVRIHSFGGSQLLVAPSIPWLVVVVVRSLSHVQLFGIPSTATCQASLSFAISQSLLKLMSIESVMPSNYFILCHPLVLLPSIFPTMKVFYNELALCIRWPKYWNFNFSNILACGCITLTSASNMCNSLKNSQHYI